MKAKISFLALVCLAFVFLLAVPSLAGTWRDDFEDGNLDGWEGLPDPCWTVEDGECSGEFFADPTFTAIRIGDAGWKDYTVKCKMKFVGIDKKPPRTGAGISFRNSGMDWARYGFLINPNSDTAVGWEVVTVHSEIPLPFTLSKDTWYELKIIVEGEHFEFYIDGKPAGEFEDNSRPSGKVGLFVRNVHAHFDDLIISGDDVEDGGSWDAAKHPEEKAVEPKGKLATSWGKLKTGY
jgi:hypothetical protein